MHGRPCERVPPPWCADPGVPLSPRRSCRRRPAGSGCSSHSAPRGGAPLRDRLVSNHVTRCGAHVIGERRMRGAAEAVQAGGAEGGGGGGRSGAGVKWRTGSPASTRTGISRYFPRVALRGRGPLGRAQPLSFPSTGALCAGPALRRGGERHRGEREGLGPTVKMTRGRGERPGHGGQRAVCCDGGGQGPTPRRDRRGNTVRGSTLPQ